MVSTPASKVTFELVDIDFFHFLFYAKKYGTSILILLFISKKFTFNISWFLNIFNKSGATYLLASFFFFSEINITSY